MNKTSIVPALGGYNQSGDFSQEQTISHSELSKCDDGSTGCLAAPTGPTNPPLVVEASQHSPGSLQNPPQCHLCSLLSHHIPSSHLWLLLPPPVTWTFHTIWEGAMYLTHPHLVPLPRAWNALPSFLSKFLWSPKLSSKSTSSAKSTPIPNQMNHPLPCFLPELGFYVGISFIL